MTMPGFTAEGSLYRTSVNYRRGMTFSVTLTGPYA